MSLTNGLCREHWQATEVVRGCWECRVNALESKMEAAVSWILEHETTLNETEVHYNLELEGDEDE